MTARNFSTKPQVVAGKARKPAVDADPSIVIEVHTWHIAVSIAGTYCLILSVSPSTVFTILCVMHPRGISGIEYGLLEYTNKGLLKLTPKGEAKLRQLELHEYKIKKPKQWDKKGRVLIFDIREERRPLRDKIRRTLITIGFVRLQDSVWVYPHDCEDLITLLKADFKIGKDVLYMIVDTIENDVWLKKHFSISTPQ